MNTTLTIKLTHTRNARHIFTANGHVYFAVRYPHERANGAPVELPVLAWRAGAQAEQVMFEECLVARVDHVDADGHPLIWTWLSAKDAELAVGRAVDAT